MATSQFGPNAANRSLLEQLFYAAIEGDPVSLSGVNERRVNHVLSAFQFADSRNYAYLEKLVTRREFLAACHDFTVDELFEHLLIGYGYRHGSTTKIERIYHLVGERGRVAILPEVSRDIRAHHARRSDGEIIIFHNHPRTGEEPEWFYLLKSLVDDLPIASAKDRDQVQRYSFSSLGMLRYLLGDGQILFYLGESGFVRQIKFPNLLALALR